MEKAQDVAKIVQDQGATNTILIFVIIGAIALGTFALKVFNDEIKTKRKERQEDREYTRKQDERRGELIEKITTVINEDINSRNDFQEYLTSHDIGAKESFNKIGEQMETIKGKMDILVENTQNVVTEEMGVDIKKDITALQNDLKVLIEYVKKEN